MMLLAATCLVGPWAWAALNVGDEVPETKVMTTDGEKTLAELRGEHGLVIFFYPKADTPGCTAECKAFSAEQEAYAKAGYKAVGASRDGVEAQKAFIEKHALTIPLICDTDNALATLFGFKPGARSTAVIGKDGKLEKLEPTVNWKTHTAELLKALSAAPEK